jgi:hypothetical protein
MPITSDGLFTGVIQGPVELGPMWAAVAVLHKTLGGKPANTCVPACAMLVGALHYLGFQAEMIAACATVFRQEDTATRFADIGRWDRPPLVRNDATTDGHAVVWAESFRRLIDPTIVQEPSLRRAAAGDETFAMPIVVPLASRELLVGRVPAVLRTPFLIAYMLFPEWSNAFDPLVTGDHGALLEYGALDLSHAVLDSLGAAAKIRDLRTLPAIYPRLGALLAGREALPAMPDNPPRGWEELEKKAKAYESE